MVDGAQLLEAIYSIADEKKIDREIVFEGIKEGFQKAYEKFFDPEAIILVEIEKNTGQVKVFKELTVVQKIEDEWLDIGLNDAKEKYGEDVTIGQHVYEPVEFDEDFSRLAIMQVGQIIKQKIREGEKNKLYEEFLSKEHEIVGGFITDMTESSYLIDIDGSIIALWMKKAIPGESFSEGDRIIVYIEEVNKENKHSQIQASRIHPDFLGKLLETEVPEIGEGVVEVKAVSREAGRRAKVAVFSHDESIDPIGSCVGSGGNRIKNVTKELNGEKIDVILWSEDKMKFVMNALAPVRVIGLSMDDEENECSIIVPNEQLSLAIGKKGMAARLVANLVSMKINIHSLDDAKEKEMDILWNGNITEAELSNPDFLNNVNKRREKSNKENNYTPKSNFEANVIDDIDEVDESIFVEETSIDDIQANLAVFEELSSQETSEFDEEEFDQYYKD